MTGSGYGGVVPPKGRYRSEAEPKIARTNADYILKAYSPQIFFVVLCIYQLAIALHLCGEESPDSKEQCTG